MSEQSPIENGIVAAIDLGSNSFHMIVASIEEGHLQVVDRLREPVRLAAGLGAKNRLAEDAQQRAIDCLSVFGQRLRELPLGSVRAVGTNTLRKARTKGDFLERASEALGHPIEVIAGAEEARLIYLGVSHSQPLIDGNRLVVDIGGGSTELIIGSGFEPLEKESLYMGCVSASQRFFPDGVITKEGFKRAKLAAHLELQTIQKRYRRVGWVEAIGASGTIKAIDAVLRAEGWSTTGITLAGLQQLVKVMIAAGHVERVDLMELKDERRPVLPGGVAVLTAIFEALAIDVMQASDWALREGVVYDLIGRIRHEDVRARTINALSERYRVDGEQAERVAATALALLRQVEQKWGLAYECAASLLEWAARLHEIGLAISHSQYHKHGAYLLAHSDLPGFALEEQKMLGLLVRAHRRKFPRSEFNEVAPRQQEMMRRLAIVLRLAVLLHRGHSEIALPEITLKAKSLGLALNFPEGWLDDHPLSQTDLESEIDYLKAIGFALTFG